MTETHRRRVLAAALVAACVIPALNPVAADAARVTAGGSEFTVLHSTVVTQNQATVYPSNVVVSSFDIERVSDVDLFVTVRGSNLETLRLLLVAPTGQQVLVLHRIAPGRVTTPNNGLNTVTLQIDDEAAGPIVATQVPQQLVSAPIQPTNTNTVNDAGPTNTTPLLSPAPQSAASLTLGAFDGINPNGTWNLYATNAKPAGPVASLTVVTSWALRVDGDRVFTQAPTAAISGTPRVTRTLTAVYDRAVPHTPDVTYTAEWQRLSNGQAIDVATGPTYTLTPADLGSQIRVRVVANRGGFIPVSATSAPTPVITKQVLVLVPPRFSAPPQVGRPTSCTTNAQGVSFAWTRGTTPLATTATYTPVAADAGARLTCTITRPGDDSFEQARRSSVSDPVLSTYAIARPSIIGDAVVGATLTCGTTTTGAKVAYEWSAFGSDGVLASTAAYKVRITDAGKILTCRARVTRGAETGVSKPAGTSRVPVPKPTVVPSTTSLARGSSLTVRVTGLVPGSYYHLGLRRHDLANDVVPPSGVLDLTVTVPGSVPTGAGTLTFSTSAPHQYVGIPVTVA
ncbi:hypothetical protein [Nocardioides sp.]|uniref:hypothetical protein n=1 Tax=Nocardioides sp. TaxID=35761 RepID=UPI003519C2DB